MPFERFTRGGRRYRPTVSINKGGIIGFSRGSYHRFSLGRYTHVVLFYDAETRRVGVMLAVDSEEPGAIPLRPRPAESGADVSAKSFLDFYGIPYQHGTEQYDPEVVDFDGQKMVVFTLAEEPPAGEDFFND